MQARKPLEIKRSWPRGTGRSNRERLVLYVDLGRCRRRAAGRWVLRPPKPLGRSGARTLEPVPSWSFGSTRTYHDEPTAISKLWLPLVPETSRPPRLGLAQRVYSEAAQGEVRFLLHSSLYR